MPVAYCSGREPCDRLISISAVPGGNPAANAEPEVYAVEWTLCSACGAYTCDRCLRKQWARCRCGAPARLLSEPERIQIAKAGPRPAPAGQAAPPPTPAVVPRIVTPPPAGEAVPIGPMLEGVEQQIEADLALGRHEKVRALCGLAATIVATQGQNAPADELPWLVGFGENFYRWGHVDEGHRYWASLHELMKKHRRDASEEGAVALASALAFQVMTGELAPSSPTAPAVLALVAKTLGPGHVLTREVQSRLGATPPSPSSRRAAAPPPLPPATPATPRPRPPGVGALAAKGRPRASTIMLNNLPPAAPPVAPSVANYDEPTRLALWVTLAFLDIASADGRVADQEFQAWQAIMAKMGLPDLWARFGQQNLYRMLNDGLLYDLSTEFAWLSNDERNRLTTVLVDFMMADGRAEPAELEAVKRIAKWLGVKVAFR
ncbi:MAG TPA: TerB family tellurite resistance protein [Polyangiaceae bacterium]|nr:TerB family tellurite resistance protein [Polyangiaceae bacterium]